MANAINKYFPGEEPSVYYVPSVSVPSKNIKSVEETQSDKGKVATKKKKSSVICQATGKLFYRYCNIRKRNPVFRNTKSKSAVDDITIPVSELDDDVRTEVNVDEGTETFLHLDYT